MFDKKKFLRLKKKWDKRPGFMLVKDRPDVDILISMVDGLRYDLALHLDDDSTEDCPGCWMEKVWEKIIKKLEKQIRNLKKEKKQDTAISDQIIQNMAKIFVALLDSSSSTAFFFMQQAYGEEDWTMIRAMMEKYAGLAKPLKRQKKK